MIKVALTNFLKNRTIRSGVNHGRKGIGIGLCIGCKINKPRSAFN